MRDNRPVCLHRPIVSSSNPAGDKEAEGERSAADRQVSRREQRGFVSQHSQQTFLSPFFCEATLVRCCCAEVGRSHPA